MKKILVSGSIAYDYIMDYDDNFEGAIGKGEGGSVNGALLISDLKKETGGTGLNIVFNLAMLKEEAILLGAIGEDYEFDPFIKDHIILTYIHKSNELLSSSAYIINDNSGGQITSFYPGAMEEASEITLSDIREELSYFIVSPNNKQAMLKNLKEGNQKGLKIFFDPGQMIQGFSKEELNIGASNSSYLIVNENEFESYMKTSEKDEVELLDDYEKIIVTLGSKGSKIISKDGVIHIGVVKVDEALDPTGAGDAYRAGLLKGLKHGFDFETSAKIGSVVSSYCVQFHGAQNHFVNNGLVIEDMKKHFGMDIEI